MPDDVIWYVVYGVRVESSDCHFAGTPKKKKGKRSGKTR
jgi:hypothetical protein